MLSSTKNKMGKKVKDIKHYSIQKIEYDLNAILSIRPHSLNCLNDTP